MRIEKEKERQRERKKERERERERWGIREWRKRKREKCRKSLKHSFFPSLVTLGPGKNWIEYLKIKYISDFRAYHLSVFFVGSWQKIDFDRKIGRVKEKEIERDKKSKEKIF